MNGKVDTIVRTIVLGLALANQVLAVFGKGTLDITEEQIYQMVSVAATIGAAVWAWWKNNSFTKAAMKADQVMKSMKAGREQ